MTKQACNPHKKRGLATWRPPTDAYNNQSLTGGNMAPNDDKQTDLMNTGSKTKLRDTQMNLSTD